MQTYTDELHEQLSRNSTPYQDPLSKVNWQSLERDQFWLPQPAISLYGLNEYQSLPMAQRRALSQFEFLNFVEAALCLEQLFIQRTAQTLHKIHCRNAQDIYRLHELREETGHILMFLELMRRCGLALPRNKFRPLSTVKWLGKYLPYDSLLFWIAVIMGEELADRLNRFIRKFPHQVNPAIYDIISVHIIDEARHISHARALIEQELKSSNHLYLRLIQPVIHHLYRSFIQAYFFPPARVYELAGLTPGKRWVLAARNNAHRLKFVDECVNTSLHVLRDNKFTLSWR